MSLKPQAASLKPQASHKIELSAVKRLVEAAGGTVYVLHQGPGRGRSGGLWGSAGIPDLLCFMRIPANDYHPARVRQFYVEVKVGRDRLRPAQTAFIALADAAGIPTVVGGVDGVIDLLRLLGIVVKRVCNNFNLC